MAGMESGFSPFASATGVHIIEGKPSMRADAMLAKFVERGGKYEIAERSATRAAASTLAS
jgi:hypothetical protein